jgi:predicted MPP superfamily phosphohydrolase
MARTATFLHITDTHVTGSGVSHDRDDHKDKIQGIKQVTREQALDQLLGATASKMVGDGRRLDAVIFSGDATVKGKAEGHQALLEMLLKHLGVLGIHAGNIVAVPGNHDVPKGTEPGSRERYAAFIDTWRSAGCITPWLDGIDPVGTTTPGLHRLVSPDGDWAIYPINSANWSHVSAVLEPPLSEVWNEIHTRRCCQSNANRSLDDAPAALCAVA